MKTFEYTFTAPSSDIQHDMLITMLAEIGFDSFMDEDRCLKAYCSADNRDDIKAAVEPDAVLLDVRISHVADVANFLAVDGDFRC